MSIDAHPPLGRRDLIAARLRAGQAVVAGALALEFQVSEDAIRRDLRALAAAGVCRRVYGGALPITPATEPVSERADKSRDSKRALARYAASTVCPGELVFLDSSSTNLVLAELLPEVDDLTVATNSIDIAAILLRRPDVQLVVIGGVVDPTVGGSVDSGATHAVMQMNIDRCFLGACAVSATGGVGAVYPADAAFKRALVSHSRHRIVLATSEKLGQRVAHRIADMRDISIYIEHDADESQLQSLALAGAHVTKVPHAD